MDKDSLKGALEALLFITDHPLKLGELKEILEIEKGEAEALIAELRQEYAERKGMQILEVAEGWQMGTRQEHGPWVRRLYKDRTTFRLSQAALETLAIVAYRQPITRAEIEEIRGVDVVAALETLLERRLIKVVGRKEALGRPLLYGTTIEFLRQFGLASLEQLPPLDSFVPAEPATADGAAAGPKTEPSLPEPPVGPEPELPVPPASPGPGVVEPLDPDAETPEVDEAGLVELEAAAAPAAEDAPE